MYKISDGPASNLTHVDSIMAHLQPQSLGITPPEVCPEPHYMQSVPTLTLTLTLILFVQPETDADSAANTDYDNPF
jgi:hypothetical protein